MAASKASKVVMAASAARSFRTGVLPVERMAPTPEGVVAER
ncbi:MAG TPA: hypothetical protein VEW07_13055 [Solirubrobacterales bacterium]|nr:hypothetical protein [Solirubrobacterales bacterium]